MLKTIKTLAAVSALALMTACGGGGGGGGSAGGGGGGGGVTNATPTIANLRYTPTSANYTANSPNSPATVNATIAYTDADGISDLSSLVISVTGFADYEVARANLTFSGTDVSVALLVDITSPAVTPFAIKAKDSAGNLSNALQATFTTKYTKSYATTITQNIGKTNFALSWIGAQLPSCATLKATTYTITSTTTRLANNGCLELGSFTATMTDGTATSWENNLSSVHLCAGPQIPSTTAGGAVDLTNGIFTWTDTTTGSIYSITYPNLIDAEVHCP